VSGVYAGQSANARVAERRRRLAEGALDLVGAGGWGALTVRGVCDRAGLTSRYFYESFVDREALAVELFDTVAAELGAVVVGAAGAAGPTAQEKAASAIGAAIDLVADDPRRARVLFGEAPGIDALVERRLGATRLFAGIVADQARDFYGVRSGEDAIVDTTAAMLTGGLAQTILAWIDGSLQTTREQLTVHCATLFVAAGEAAVALARARP
jgi:AcrR family transcriptional regulator